MGAGNIRYDSKVKDLTLRALVHIPAIGCAKCRFKRGNKADTVSCILFEKRLFTKSDGRLARLTDCRDAEEHYKTKRVHSDR